MLAGMFATRGQNGIWTLATQWAHDESYANWAGFTLRVVIPASALIAGSRVRVTLSAESQMDIPAVYVGHAAASGDVYDFESTPTRLLFGGNTTASVPANGDLVSDGVSFSVNPAKNLIVSAYASSGRSRKITTLPGWTTRYTTGNDAATVNPTGYLTSAYAANLVRKVEVFVP